MYLMGEVKTWCYRGIDWVITGSSNLPSLHTHKHTVTLPLRKKKTKNNPMRNTLNPRALPNPPCAASVELLRNPQSFHTEAHTDWSRVASASYSINDVCCSILWKEIQRGSWREIREGNDAEMD